MNEAEFLEIGKGAIFVLLKISLPILMVALVVGLVISLFQALTQIQEMTLSFVPKIIAISLSLVFFTPFMLDTLITFTHEMNDKIVNIEKSEGG